MIQIHPRVITFINNLYVGGYFQQLISDLVIPSLMTLLMYNVTNHIKSRKNFEVSSAQHHQNHNQGGASSNNSSHHQYEEEDLTQPQEEYSERYNLFLLIQLFIILFIYFYLFIYVFSLDDSHQAPSASDYEIDPMYDDDLYNEFIESACYLLGNLTTSGNKGSK